MKNNITRGSNNVLRELISQKNCLKQLLFDIWWLNPLKCLTWSWWNSFWPQKMYSVLYEPNLSKKKKKKITQNWLKKFKSGFWSLKHQKCYFKMLMQIIWKNCKIVAQSNPRWVRGHYGRGGDPDTFFAGCLLIVWFTSLIIGFYLWFLMQRFQCCGFVVISHPYNLHFS